ncbi:MAG: choice-of-anchor D domain-containing protein [Marmoricola sp.]
MNPDLVTLTPNPLDFGYVVPATTKQLVMTVKNTGTASERFTVTGVAAPFASDQTSAPSTPRAGACWYAGSSGTVTQLVAPGGTCNLYFTYKPDATNANTDHVDVVNPVVTVAGSTGTVLGQTSIQLKGRSSFDGPPATSANLGVNPAQIDFGAVPIGYTDTRTVTVTNNSNGKVQVENLGFAAPFSDGGTGAAGECTDGTVYNVLAVGQSCTYVITYAPTEAGSSLTSMTFRADASTARAGTRVALTHHELTPFFSVRITGSSGKLATTFTPASLAFGNVTQGGSKQLTVLVKNTGGVPMGYRLTAPSGSPYSSVVASTDANPCQTSSGTNTIAPGASCTLTVRFAPTLVGSQPAGLTVHLGRPGGVEYTTKTVNATGTGVKVATTYTPTSLAFGKVLLGTAKTMVLTVKNTSTTALYYTPQFPASSPFSQRADASGADTAACAGTQARLVQPGTTCTITAVYTPTAPVADKGTLSVLVARPGTSGTPVPIGPTPLAMTGTGGAPTYTLTPTSLSFGSVLLGDTKTLVVTVKNTSTVGIQVVPTITAGDFALNGSDPSACSGSAGPRTIGAGATCTVTTVLAPRTVGALKATITLSIRVPVSGRAPLVAGSRAVAATATGAAPTYTLSAASLAFASVPRGQSKSMTITVKNTSKVTLSFVPSVTAGTPFSVPAGGAGACRTTGGSVQVGPALSCTVTVVFAPTAAVKSTGTLTVAAYRTNFTGPVGSKSAALSGTGT